MIGPYEAFEDIACYGEHHNPGNEWDFETLLHRLEK